DSPAANALGEVVWSQYDPASGYSQIFSSSRGQLTSDSTNHTAPSINKYGDVVWSQNDGIYGIIDGRAIRLIYDTNSYSPVISDNGEIAYVSGWSRIVSTVRGVLYTGSYPGGLGMNNLGDLVWIENGGQIYSLPHGTTAPVQLTNDSAWHGSASINDSGEVVWDQWTPTGSRIFSSTRGELTFTCPVADNHVWPKITNCGTVVFTAWNNNGEKIVYRLGSGDSCAPAGDTARPEISSRSPGVDALNVPLSAPITATFSKQLDPATVSASTVIVQSAGLSVAGTVVIYRCRHGTGHDQRYRKRQPDLLLTGYLRRQRCLHPPSRRRKPVPTTDRQRSGCNNHCVRQLLHHYRHYRRSPAGGNVRGQYLSTDHPGQRFRRRQRQR